MESKQKDTRSYNVGKSNYAELPIQPWDIIDDWRIYEAFIGFILGYLVRTKEGDSRVMDLEKIWHNAIDRVSHFDKDREAKRMKSVFKHNLTPEKIAEKLNLGTIEQYIVKELYDIAFGNKTYYEAYSNIAMYSQQIIDSMKEEGGEK